MRLEPVSAAIEVGASIESFVASTALHVNPSESFIFHYKQDPSK